MTAITTITPAANHSKSGETGGPPPGGRFVSGLAMTYSIGTGPSRLRPHASSHIPQPFRRAPPSVGVNSYSTQQNHSLCERRLVPSRAPLRTTVPIVIAVRPEKSRRNLSRYIVNARATIAIARPPANRRELVRPIVTSVRYACRQLQALVRRRR